MAKAKKPVVHPCWAKVNKALEPSNGELEMATTISLGSSRMGRALFIPVRKLKTKGPKPPPKLFPQFCPFCGDKIVDGYFSANGVAK